MFIQESAFEKVFCDTRKVLSLPQCISAFIVVYCIGNFVLMQLSFCNGRQWPTYITHGSLCRQIISRHGIDLLCSKYSDIGNKWLNRHSYVVVMDFDPPTNYDSLHQIQDIYTKPYLGYMRNQSKHQINSRLVSSTTSYWNNYRISYYVVSSVMYLCINTRNECTKITT